MDNTGFVYIMIKESSPGYLKIGRTEKKPHLRAMELDSTDSPTPSIVVYYTYCEDCFLLEKEAHLHLDNKRVRSNREWFICKKMDAIKAIQDIAKANNLKLYYEEFFSLEQQKRENDLDVETDEENQIDQEELVRKCIESMHYWVNRAKEQKSKYKQYFDEREKELNERKKNGESGTDSLYGLAKASYFSKISEIDRERDDTINSGIKRLELYFDNAIIDKIRLVSEEIKSGKLVNISSNENISNVNSNVKVISLLNSYLKNSSQ